MDTPAFWKIIDSTRRRSKGDPDAHMEALISDLSRLPEEEIIDFDRIFTELWHKAYSWDLWAAAYIMEGGCSDDGFMDFRGWLISKGQKVYENALSNPDSLARFNECTQVEGFQYVTSKAWEEKTGDDFTNFPARKMRHP